jgi:hypothetical protein
MAGVLGRLENWVLGEEEIANDLFASDVRVNSPRGEASEVEPPSSARLIASGGDDAFGSVVYEQQDEATGHWARKCLVYFAEGGQIRQIYES